MIDLSKYKVRSGYIVDFDACRRYLEQGHNFSFSDIRPHSQHGWKEMSREKRTLKADENIRYQLVQRFHYAFIRLRRKAPTEARVRLVPPHGEYLIAYPATSPQCRADGTRNQHSLEFFTTRSLASTTDDTSLSLRAPVADPSERQGRPTSTGSGSRYSLTLQTA